MKRQLKNCWSKISKILDAYQRGFAEVRHTGHVDRGDRGSNGRSFALALIATWLCWTCLTMSSGRHGSWPKHWLRWGHSNCVFSCFSQKGRTSLQRVTPYQQYRVTLVFINSGLSYGFILGWQAFLSFFRVQQREGTHSFPFLTSFTSLRMSLHCLQRIENFAARTICLKFLCWILPCWRRVISTLEHCSCWYSFYAITSYTVMRYWAIYTLFA